VFFSWIKIRIEKEKREFYDLLRKKAPVLQDGDEL